MSSLPSPSGASDLVTLLYAMEQQIKEVHELECAAKKLPVSQQKLREQKSELRKMLENMDCNSMGNAGWDNRIGWLMRAVMFETERRTCAKENKANDVRTE